jgi:hypothetical protein
MCVNITVSHVDARDGGTGAECMPEARSCSLAQRVCVRMLAMSALVQQERFPRSTCVCQGVCGEALVTCFGPSLAFD